MIGERTMAEARGRNCKRLWEIGATAALLLAVAVAVGGFFAWRERQRRLDRELVTLLRQPFLEDGDCARMRTLLRQGANVHLRGTGEETVLTVAASMDHLPLLEEALARGADVNVGNN
jgi:ankyrin repeat protein